MIIVHTPSKLPEPLIESFVSHGIRCVEDQTPACRAVVVQAGSPWTSAVTTSTLPVIVLTDGEDQGESRSPADSADACIRSSSPDEAAMKLARLLGVDHAGFEGGMQVAGWVLLTESGRIQAVSRSLPVLARKRSVELSPGKELPTDNPQIQMQDTWIEDSGRERLVCVSFRSRTGYETERRERYHRFITELPGVLSEHDPEAAGKRLLTCLVDFLDDRPVALLLGEDMGRRFISGMSEKRGRQLTELMANYNVRTILRETGAPLGTDAILVLPGAALRLGSLPVDAGDTGMPNLLVLLMRDPADRPVGSLIVEYPSDQLPDAEQVRSLEHAVRYHAVAVRWHQALAHAGESITLMESLIDNDPAGMLVLDENGRIRKINTALVELTGHRRDETVGRTLNRIFMPEQTRRILDMLKHGGIGVFETEIENMDGDPRPVRVRVYPFSQRDHTHHVIQLEDLAADWALRQKELEVERLQAVFSAAVAIHDKINTPLTIILAHLERLKYKWKSGLTWPDLEKSLISVEKQVDKVTEIIERMRDMKRYRVREYALRNISMVDLSDSTEADEPED